MTADKKKILVVDDDKMNLDMLTHILGREYTMYVAKNGETALKRAAGEQPDLILLDVVMSDMSGYDVLALLKEDEATRHIPVIMITALGNGNSEERSLLLGAVDFIRKPFSDTVIKTRIRSQLKNIRQGRMLEEFGMIDPMTHIMSRRGFIRRLQSEWKSAARNQKPLAILSMDVDHLKQLNDTYGFLQGDVLLQALAQMLRESVRPDIDAAAYIGNGRFAIIMADASAEEAGTMAETIRQAVWVMEAPCTGQMTSQATVSIGVAAACPGKDRIDNSDDLWAEACRELERAKQEGRNRVNLSPNTVRT